MKRDSNCYPRWAPEEIDILIKMVRSGYTGAEVAKALNRTVAAVYSRSIIEGVSFVRDVGDVHRWVTTALGAARQRAKIQGVPFDLLHDDVLPGKFCPVLGLELDYTRRKGRGQKARHDASPELDKVIPNVGYVPGNVRVISSLANRIKGRMTLEMAECVYKYMLENVGQN